MKYLMLITLLLTNCAPKSHTPILSIPEKYQEIYSRFLDDAKAQGVSLNITDLIIQDADLYSAQENGKCTVTTNETPVISVNNNPNSPFYWDGATDPIRENLLYHELGHCILYRMHDFNMNLINIGGDLTYIPESIMTPYLIDPYTYLQVRDQYIEELFKNKTNIIQGLTFSIR